jgi:O-Antigen ligase
MSLVPPFPPQRTVRTGGPARGQAGPALPTPRRQVPPAVPAVPDAGPFSPLSLGLVIVGGLALGALVVAATLGRHESTAVAAVACAVAFVVALRRITIVALALIPVVAASSAPVQATLPITMLAGVLALAAATLFCVGRLRFRPVHLWLAVLGGMALLGYFFPAERLAASDQSLPVLIAILTGLVVVAVFVAEPPTASVLLRMITITGAAAGVLASIQGETLEGRLEGLGTNPNGLAVYLAAPVVISFGLALHRRNPLWLAPGAACLPALLASQSREGFLAAVAGVAFLLLQGRPRPVQVLITVAAAAVVALPGQLTALASLGAGSRPAAELATDNQVRLQVASFAAHTAVTHPLLGIGLGQFPDYAAASNGFGVYIATTNQYLQLAAEGGLLSLAALVALLWLAVSRRRTGELAIVRAVVVAFAVAMLFIDSFESALVALPFWACLGVLLAEGGPADG